MLPFAISIYICIGAIVTGVLFQIEKRHTPYRGDYEDLSGYCVAIGVFWVIAAPFAFALCFAKYGFPRIKKKEGKDE